MHEVELVERVWQRVESALSLPEWRKELVAEVVQATLKTLDIPVQPDGRVGAIVPTTDVALHELRMTAHARAHGSNFAADDYKTTDYCARCGASPDAAEHGPFSNSHPYEPPKPKVPDATGKPPKKTKNAKRARKK